MEKPQLWSAKVQLPSALYPIFSSLTRRIVLAFLGRSLESTTYGLQSSIFGPPSIIFHKSLTNLVKVLVEILLRFARDLEVCHIFQVDLWPFCQVQTGLSVVFPGIRYATEFVTWNSCLHFIWAFNWFWKYKLSNVFLRGWCFQEWSSGFGELYCSVLESVIYKEYKSFHSFWKSGFTNESGVWDWVRLWKWHFSFVLAGWD